MNRPLQAVGGSSAGAPHQRAGAVAAIAVLASLALLFLGSFAQAAPFIWDQDTDRLDDRIDSVRVVGYTFAFEESDTLKRQRIDVSRITGGLLFGVYVVFDHDPTSTDVAALTALGMPILHRFEAVYAFRSLATYAQARAAANLIGVERVEAIPVLYPMVREGSADIAVRDPSKKVFPTWAGTGGGDGTGGVIAFLDTGINDAPNGAYPGHESLIGRCLGGAEFTHGDSLGDTPRDGSVNPVDHGGAVTESHGTHVASIALGTGGASGYAIGVAPGARFVDVKVLNDLGVGTGIAEAIDWCIHNRARDWGVAGFEGIHVINLSLSSTDAGDGTDVASRLAERAVQEGIVVVSSIGNEGKAGYVPSPAAGAGVLAVGAIDVQHTALPGDDQWASFNDYGPRADDGDGDPSDEMKPDLLAPGVAVLGADGDLSSDGAQYHRLSGTSMATAFVSGVAVALKASHPSLTPATLAELLRSTARRQLTGVPAGVPGADPRWSSAIGYGIVDLYAAKLELDQPTRSQIDRLELAGAGSQITAVLRTQRELGAARFVFERAADVSGAPGAFAAVDSVPATGSSSLAGLDNRESYPRVWNVPVGERAVKYWYRVSYVEGGVQYASPARDFISPSGPAAATIQLTIVHNAYDNDIAGTIEVGGGSAPHLGRTSAASAGYSVPLPGTSAAVSSDWVSGLSTTGNVAWTFRIDVPTGAADAFVPPTSANPWWLTVDEAGYLNRSGRITDYRIIWHASGGDLAYVGGPLPMQTLEGNSVSLAAPQAATGVGPPQVESGIHFGPNPVAVGGTVWFTLPPSFSGTIRIVDLAGRAIAAVPIVKAGTSATARWDVRDAGGNPLPSGIYFARAGATPVGRLVVIRR
jgi:subtilisin family serine protease